MAPLPVESRGLRSREANPSPLGRVGIGEQSGSEALLAEREGYCTVAILLRKMSGAEQKVGTTFGLWRRTEDSPPYRGIGCLRLGAV
jgi:hypothetical protein